MSMCSFREKYSDVFVTSWTKYGWRIFIFQYFQEDQKDETPFHAAISCISQALKTQIINRSNDEVAICFFNTVSWWSCDELKCLFARIRSTRCFTDIFSKYGYLAFPFLPFSFCLNDLCFLSWILQCSVKWWFMQSLNLQFQWLKHKLYLACFFHFILHLLESIQGSQSMNFPHLDMALLVW